MNTPKKEDMKKELEMLYPALGREAVNFFAPLAKIINATGRALYLEHELSKITPRPQPIKVPVEATPEAPEEKET